MATKIILALLLVTSTAYAQKRAMEHDINPPNACVDGYGQGSTYTVDEYGSYQN